MFGRKRNRKNARQPERRRSARFETLESRRLLSASIGSEILKSDAVFLQRAASSSASIQGYTPQETQTAYDFNSINLGNGVSANGRGQTIAIVDAYNDPSIASDLAVFDQQFGISAPPSLKVVSQSGGSSLPTADSGWDGEIALDVEWAHAIAPAANILLVEASSATVQDLTAAVNYARHASGVSVVSMSWGGSEFFSWNGSEFTGQTQYDPIFTTPSGHQGVTFVAAAGDSGSFSGVEWPASSTNVLSVGGTSLNLDSSGTYGSESSWSGTSGGYSQVEAQPSYQNEVQSTGARSVPDVAYDADPNTGFAVYDSVPNQGYSGWQEVGGTSAGAPQWAALVAIADQGRVSAGRGTLDGATQTLPILYSLYSAPGTSGYSTYTTNFNDVIDNSGFNGYHWWWGWGYSQGQATAGYDTATGLGTPHANSIVSALVGTSSSSSGGSSSSGSSSSSGGNNSTTTPAQLPASPITGTITTSLPVSVIGGSNGSLRVRLTNSAGSRFSGPISITLDASTDGSVSANDTLVTTLTIPKLNLGAGASRTVRLKFSYPTGITDGSYFLVAVIDATSTNTSPSDAVSSAPVTISAPTVDLAAAFPDASVTVNPGHGDDVSVTVTNVGNVAATGTLSLNLYASADQVLDSSDTLLAAMPARRINLRPGRSMTFHVHFVAPAADPAGTYNLVASITSSTNPADNNSANDTAFVPTA